MYVLKTRKDGAWVAWTSSASQKNIHKLIDLHKVIKPGVPYIIDRV